MMVPSMFATRIAQETALAKVWDDPALDVYNEDAADRPEP